MSVENKIREFLNGDLSEASFPGAGKNMETSSAMQGSSQKPEIGLMHKGQSGQSVSSAAATVKAGGSVKENTPMKQGSSQDAKIDSQDDQDSQGKTQASKMKKMPSLSNSGAGAAPNFKTVADANSVINQSSSKGNVYKEDTDLEEFGDDIIEVSADDLISEEDFDSLSPDEQEDYEMVEVLSDELEESFITEEEYEALSDEERAEYDEVELEEGNAANKAKKNAFVQKTGDDLYKKALGIKRIGHAKDSFRGQILRSNNKSWARRTLRGDPVKLRPEYTKEDYNEDGLEEGNAANKAKKNSYVTKLGKSEMVKGARSTINRSYKDQSSMPNRKMAAYVAGNAISTSDKDAKRLGRELTKFRKEETDLEEGNAENKAAKNAAVSKIGSQVKKFREPTDKTSGRASMRPQPHDSKDAGRAYKKSPNEFWKKKGIGTGMHKEELENVVNNMFSEETNLSEEFKDKAASLFEAVVTARVTELREELENEAAEVAAEFVESYTEELVEKMDSYLNYVAEQWLENNQVAVEQGLRSEITEDFIAGLKVLFKENYIDVPEEQYDVMGEMEEAISDLTEQVNSSIEESIELKKQLIETKRELVLNRVSSDLALTEAEKLRALTENVDFDNDDLFEEKMTVIKNNYFRKNTATASVVTEETEGTLTEEVNSTVAVYAELLSRKNFGK